MAVSRNPSVFLQERETADGVKTYRIRFERDGIRFPSLNCGPAKAHAEKLKAKLKVMLWEREASLERLIEEWRSSKITADNFASEVYLYLSTGKEPPRHVAEDAPVTHTVLQLSDKYLAESMEHKAKRAHEVDRYALRKFMAHFGADRVLEALTPEDMRTFAEGMTGKKGRKKGVDVVKPLSKTSKAIYLHALRTALNRAVKGYGWAIPDLFKGVIIPERAQRQRFIHPDEFRKVKPHALKFVRGGRNLWEILDLQRRQGYRTSAVCGLDGRMLERVDGDLRIHLIQPARLGLNRTVDLKDTELYSPVHPKARYIFKNAPKVGPLFAAWDRHAVAKYTRLACKAAGVEPFQPHHLKHTFVTTYLKAGGTLAICSAVTGTSLRTLKEHYGHLEKVVHSKEMARVKYGRDG